MTRHLLHTAPFFAAVLVALNFLSCKPQDNPDPVPEEPDPSEELYLRLITSGVSDYSIAYSAGSALNAKGFADALKDLTGAELPRYNAADKSQEKEILIGPADRQETKDLLAELKGEVGYIIAVVGDKLVVAGSDDVWTAMALQTFQSKVLFSKTYLSDKSFMLTRVYKSKESYSDPQLIARLLKRGVPFDLRTSLVLNCPGESTIRVGQGAASDGQYFYFVVRTSDEKQAIVYKYDMTSLSLVLKSPVFYAGHCNDMTYDSVKRQLIVAHGSSEGKILTPIDAATLMPFGDVNISVGSGAITYNALTNRYAISQGGSTFYVTDNSFKVALDKKRTDSTGYVAQGMGSDDYYVYFPMSGDTDNVLVTYDWDGKYVDVLHVPLALEAESMFYAAGNYYVSFYPGSQRGATLYRIDPVYNYAYTK